MDSNNSFSGLRVALLLVGGSLEVEGAVTTSLALSVLIVLVEENLGDEELDTHCFSEGDLISRGISRCRSSSFSTIKDSINAAKYKIRTTRRIRLWRHITVEIIHDNGITGLPSMLSRLHNHQWT